MIPLRLNWQRRVDGFEPKVLVRPNGSRVLIAEPRSGRTDPVLHERTDLENPVALHLVNCETARDYMAFLDRFGSLEPREIVTFEDDITVRFQYPPPEKSISIGALKLPVVREAEQGYVDLQALQSFAFFLKMHIVITLATRINAEIKVGYLNGLMGRASVVAHPFFICSGDATRFVLEANTLFDFIVLEVAAIHDAGAVATSCEHCHKFFLTGPLTGRRSHAKYCRDRCRVAAMRTRNAAKED